MSDRPLKSAVELLRDFLALLRELLILLVLGVFLVFPTWISPLLERIGLALADAGFTEVEYLGFKQDLRALREEAEEAQLLSGRALEALQEGEVDYAKDLLGTVTSSTIPAPASQSAPRDEHSWIVVLGADRTLDEASFEVRRAEKQGYDNAQVIKRAGWYRTVIPFDTEERAQSELANISENLRQGAYIRDLLTWCIDRRESAGYTECRTQQQ
jgi:hypothetical protein